MHSTNRAFMEEWQEKKGLSSAFTTISPMEVIGKNKHSQTDPREFWLALTPPLCLVRRAQGFCAKSPLVHTVHPWIRSKAEVEQVNSYRFSGINMTENLSWKKKRKKEIKKQRLGYTSYRILGRLNSGATSHKLIIENHPDWKHHKVAWFVTAQCRKAP